jgi:hypothetical protein
MHHTHSPRARRRPAILFVALALAVLTPVAAVVAVTPAEASAAVGGQQAALNQVAAIASATKALVPSTATAIERGHVRAALAQVQSAQTDPSPWTDVPSTSTPADVDEFSVGFDNGQNVPSGLPESFGTRVAIVTVVDGAPGFVGSILTLQGEIVTCSLDHSIDSAADLLTAVGPDATCPTATVSKRSAITSAWAWGNSVDPAVDNRGLNQPGMAPQAMADFAHSHRMTTIFLAVPWAADQGAIAGWLSASVDALHAKGIRVAALGGDTAWLAEPALADQWLTAARHAADFDAVELDIEPWAGTTDPDFSVITPQLTTLIDTARSAAGSLPIGVDLPWWLTGRAYGSATVFDAILPHVDSVAIAAFANHAVGSDGIIALSKPAVVAASAAGIPFTIGVETDTPAVAGGPQFTFYDAGASTLATETAKVRTAFAHTAGYRGVTAEHLLSWAALLDRSS